MNVLKHMGFLIRAPKSGVPSQGPILHLEGMKIYALRSGQIARTSAGLGGVGLISMCTLDRPFGERCESQILHVHGPDIITGGSPDLSGVMPKDVWVLLGLTGFCPWVVPLWFLRGIVQTQGDTRLQCQCVWGVQFTWVVYDQGYLHGLYMMHHAVVSFHHFS